MSLILRFRVLFYVAKKTVEKEKLKRFLRFENRTFENPVNESESFFWKNDFEEFLIHKIFREINYKVKIRSINFEFIL